MGTAKSVNQRPVNGEKPHPPTDKWSLREAAQKLRMLFHELVIDELDDRRLLLRGKGLHPVNQFLDCHSDVDYSASGLTKHSISPADTIG
jgi:hypothetical protein